MKTNFTHKDRWHKIRIFFRGLNEPSKTNIIFCLKNCFAFFKFNNFLTSLSPFHLSFLPSSFPSFLPFFSLFSFYPSFLPPFLLFFPSLLPSYIPFLIFLLSFLFPPFPSFLLFFLFSLPSLLPFFFSFLPSILHLMIFRA